MLKNLFSQWEKGQVHKGVFVIQLFNICTKTMFFFNIQDFLLLVKDITFSRQLKFLSNFSLSKCLLYASKYGIEVLIKIVSCKSGPAEQWSLISLEKVNKRKICRCLTVVIILCITFLMVQVCDPYCQQILQESLEIVSGTPCVDVCEIY